MGGVAYNLHLLGELITGLEKAFQNKLHSRADQNTFFNLLTSECPKKLRAQ